VRPSRVCAEGSSRGTVREYTRPSVSRDTAARRVPLNSTVGFNQLRIWPIMGFMTWSCCLGSFYIDTAAARAYRERGNQWRASSAT